MSSRLNALRDYISPLLQPPLNRLFVPRPTPEYIPASNFHIDSHGNEHYHAMRPHLTPTASFVSLLSASAASSMEEEGSLDNTLEKPLSRKERLQRKRESMREYIETEAISWNPKENENATEDAYKTIFVGRLDYTVTEPRLRREFERFGPIKSIKMICRKDNGKPRGYAFIEYERERDMKAAWQDADGMKIEGRRVVVDVERGRTVRDWRPRRLGGGLGKTRVGGKDVNQRHSGRDTKAPAELVDGMGGRRPSSSRRRSPSPRRR